MAIVYSYPSAQVELSDLIIGTKTTERGKATKSFLVSDIIALVNNDPTAYVPYSGATNDVNLGAHSIYTAGGARLYDDGTIEGASYQFINTFSYLQDLSTVTRIWQLPDQSGTIALTADLPPLPTLQSVLDANHNLTNGLNFQGTGAGNVSSGTNINALGSSAAGHNSGSNVNALGTGAAIYNAGNYVNAFGLGAANNNLGSNINAFGTQALSGSTGAYNSGNNINAFGPYTAFRNSGSNVNAFGSGAATQNGGSDVNIFGRDGGASNLLSGMTIFSNNCLPTYANHTAAAAAITIGAGASAGSTYLYHNQATNSIGAVRL